MSTNRDFRFTVEQIWLLQRLRGSGLSRDQIVAGLEDLDRLDGAGSNPQTHFSSFSNNLGKLTNPSYPTLATQTLLPTLVTQFLLKLLFSQSYNYKSTTVKRQ